MEITKYKLSKDEQGLLAYFISKDNTEHFYHIHSNELTNKQKQIHRDLLVD